jgi:hypothetical protein
MKYPSMMRPLPDNTAHPAVILERFLAFLRASEDELKLVTEGVSVSTKLPEYLELMQQAIEKLKIEAIIEAAEAAEKVKHYGASIHNQYIADAKEILDNKNFDKSTRMDLTSPHELTPRSGPLNGPIPADLVYVGRKLPVGGPPEPKGPNDIE